MTARPGAPVQQLHRSRHLWAVEVPWLPDLLSGATTMSLGNPVHEAFGRQIAFLRALAAGAPAGSALQLRFLCEPDSGEIRCHLVGAAASAADARQLNTVTNTAFPPEFPVEPVGADDVEAVVRSVDADTIAPDHVVEIRRLVDDLDPTVEAANRGDPVLFPWAWTPQAMLSSLGLLRFQPRRTVLAVHVEPATLPGDVAIFLQDEVRRLRTDLKAEQDNPLAVAVVQGYLRWLRLLPQSCLSLRVVVASEGPLTPGLGESLSTDLTRSFEAGSSVTFGAADVLRPRTPADLDGCARLLDELRSRSWQLSTHPQLAKLTYLFDPLEANTAFRMPVAPKGGLAGIASRRVPAIGRGTSAPAATARQIALGTTSSGIRYALDPTDLNRHVLVAGLPGFGKTRTVQLLLRELLRNADVPFLVIDPSKSDYRPFMALLRAEGSDPQVVRLSRDAVACNPMAVPAGVDPSIFAGRVIAAFDAAFDLSTVWPLAHVQLSRAVYGLYGSGPAGNVPGGVQPTLRDLYRHLGHQLRRSGFSDEVRGNLEGSLLGRLDYLAMGPAGQALSGGPSDAAPWADILARPTLIELGGFAAPPERALMFSLLIAGLVSYREANPSDGLRHVTVLEEAHRVLRPGQSRDAGVEVFVDAIAELRGSGEGFVVVDQAPSLLHPSVMKLTGTKIAHRLVEANERAAIGASMVLDVAQTEDLARLGPRRTIAYSASADAATLVEVDALDHPKHLAEESLVPVASSLAMAADPEPLYCTGCPVMCRGQRGRELGDAVSDGLTPAALLDLAAKASDSYAERYCLAAAALGRRHSDRPAELRSDLEELGFAYRRRLRRATSKAPT